MKSAQPLEVATREPQGSIIERAQPILPAVQPFDIEGMFRFALEKSAGPEAMTTLMNIRRELNAEASKKAFDEALSAFQCECPTITKTKSVPTKSGDTAYKYAPIEMVEQVIRPIERKHGFTHTFNTDTASQPGWVIATCIVTHCAGHTRESVIKLPLGTKTGIMSDTQVYAGALTFANRRALANVYGLVLAGEDLDGAMHKPRPAGPTAAASASRQPEVVDGTKALVKEVWTLLKPVVSQDSDWNQKTWTGHNSWLWREDVLDGVTEAMPNLKPERIKEVIAAIKSKI